MNPEKLRAAQAKLAELAPDDVRLPSGGFGKRTSGGLDDGASSTARTLGRWLRDPAALRVPVVCLPHLVANGRVTLLSGREKIGKSTLLGGAVAQASRGDSVLGVPLDGPVTTLWYALDEHPSDAVTRFSDLGADPDRVIINAEPRSMEDLLTHLARDIAAFPLVKVVVIDTLSRVLAMSCVDPNSSREVEPVLAQLVDFFHRHDLAAILLYHTGKAGKEYRGSTAIGATVDDILTLRKRGAPDEDDFDDDEADDGRRLLVADGRNLRGRLQLSCVAGVYSVFEESAPPRFKLLEALRDHGTVKGRSELCKLAGVRKTTGLKVLTELILEGLVTESGRLKLSLRGVAELGSRQPSGSARRVPPAKASEFPSSREFPEEGTAPEPRREPEPTALKVPSSRIGNPTLQKQEPTLDVAIPS